MNSLAIPNAVFHAMLEHAREAAPVEACGILAGTDGRVASLHRMTNSDNSPDHFTMAPHEQFAVIKRIRAEGQQMLAIFHSHPASPARPSEEDIRLAFTPNVVYVILSLLDPEQPVVRGYLIDGANVTETQVNVEQPDEVAL